MIECTNSLLLHGVELPCGKCVLCRARRARDWAFRLNVEHKHSDTCHFLTLTYDDNHVPDGYVKDHWQKFIKAIRDRQKKLESHLKDDDKYQPIKYWSCFEYGAKTGRPHWHAITFNMYNKIAYYLQDYWGKGFVKVGQGNEKTINYAVSYLVELDPKDEKKQLCSKNLGADLEDLTRIWDQADPWTRQHGIQKSVPRYYLKKLDQDTREIMNAKKTLLHTFEDTEKYNEAEQHYSDPWEALKEQRELRARKKLEAKKRQKLHLGARQN